MSADTDPRVISWEYCELEDGEYFQISQLYDNEIVDCVMMPRNIAQELADIIIETLGEE